MGCVILLILFVVVGVLAWFLDPKLRKQRAFEAELTTREPVPDEALFERYFTPEEAAADVPRQVRKLFAKHMCYPAEKLLPDDDFWFFWCEIDPIDLLNDLEQTFSIMITDEDAAKVPGFTIRAATHLITKKIRPERT